MDDIQGNFNYYESSLLEFSHFISEFTNKKIDIAHFKELNEYIKINRSLPLEIRAVKEG
jgi:hypothetical protein